MENLFFTHAGMQLSILDGVPIAVKDEIDCLPYPTSGKFSSVFWCTCHFYASKCEFNSSWVLCLWVNESSIRNY